MCFATPGKVIKIKGKIATIKMPHHKHQVDTSLLKKVKIGDYIAIHHGLLCHCLTPEQLKQLKLWTDKALKNL